ncbi:uncharacterized protein FIBRA_06547 [Fibroporia radiculosa]|uniref:FAD-binding domain-containing protein n=1 Tax=Fibroporia radiculosa TaxID=599839 RepID=J4GBU0_9APHY|nr:uncharacterized protein FIBRA_06547 [Fibroporia radiculosa]CCM04373.1 predicted protein [Fibroporia radiculosa]
MAARFMHLHHLRDRDQEFLDSLRSPDPEHTGGGWGLGGGNEEKAEDEDEEDNMDWDQAQAVVERMVSQFLPIEFIIIGGGVAGLTAACALSKVGHRVTVLEQGDDFMQTEFSGGCRLAPNMTKKYYDWGLEEEFRKISMTGHYITLAYYDSGNVSIAAEWGRDYFAVDRVGEYVQMHFADFRRVLYESALKFGATIRSKTVVKALSPTSNRPSVTLDTGEEIFADVLVGADGSHSISRATMIGGADEMTRKNLALFNAEIPREKLAADPDVAQFLTENQYGQLILWMGDGKGAIGFCTAREEFTIQAFLPDPKGMPFPCSAVDKSTLLEAMQGCEPRLYKLAQMSDRALVTPIVERPHLEDWVHENGRMLVIGEAAHPLTTGSVYAPGLAAGDAMMLGRLFSHLRSHEQITPFLFAVEEVRQKRIARALKVQMVNPAVLSLPAGVEHKESLKVAENITDLSPVELNELLEEALTIVFTYDPEDEADDWWMQWGMLRERAGSAAQMSFSSIPFVQEDVQTTSD